MPYTVAPQSHPVLHPCLAATPHLLQLASNNNCGPGVDVTTSCVVFAAAQDARYVVQVFGADAGSGTTSLLLAHTPAYDNFARCVAAITPKLGDRAIPRVLASRVHIIH